MSASDEMDRKTFLKASLAWAAVTLSGCGGGSSSGGTGGSGAGTGGMSGGTGGMSGGAMCGDQSGATVASSYSCTTNTDNGSHSHPLTIPGGDVEAGETKADCYVLEDGGTGHTHTVHLESYELLYLKFGTAQTITSSETNGHTHPCVINCSMS